MSRLPWITALVLVAVPVVAWAQSQQEMNRQAADEAVAADRKLNATYQRLLPKLDATAKKKLVTAELAWIKFRDAQCEFEGDWFRGGTMSPLMVSTCKTRLTNARIKDLESAISAYGGH